MENVMTTKQEPLIPERVRALGSRMRALLELVGSPVGVRLLFDEKERPGGVHTLTDHRHCQAVMKARSGWWISRFSRTRLPVST